MFVAYLIVTVLTAAANVFSATLDFIRYKQVSINMARAGVPESWMTLLGILKGVAALGLLVGIGIPLIGAAAALGLVCCATHERKRLDRAVGLWLGTLNLLLPARNNAS
jgi:DoxX-like family